MFAGPVFADDASVAAPKSAVCEKEAKTLLQSLGAKGPWFAVAATDDWQQILRSPTAMIGTWIEWRSKKDLVEIAQVSSENQKLWTWKLGHCSSAQPNTPHFKMLEGRSGLNDQDLRQLISQKKKALVYIWSPSASLSVKYMQVFKDEAARRGLAWTPVQSKDLASVDLVFRGGLMHFPTSFIVQDGKISKRIIGAMEKNTIGPFFDDYLREMK